MWSCSIAILAIQELVSVEISNVNSLKTELTKSGKDSAQRTDAAQTSSRKTDGSAYVLEIEEHC